MAAPVPPDDSDDYLALDDEIAALEAARRVAVEGEDLDFGALLDEAEHQGAAGLTLLTLGGLSACGRVLDIA